MVDGGRCQSRIKNLQSKSIKRMWTIRKWMFLKDKGEGVPVG